jgi:hypothetical protein
VFEISLVSETIGHLIFHSKVVSSVSYSSVSQALFFLRDAVLVSIFIFLLVGMRHNGEGCVLSPFSQFFKIILD